MATPYKISNADTGSDVVTSTDDHTAPATSLFEPAMALKFVAECCLELRHNLGTIKRVPELLTAQYNHAVNELRATRLFTDQEAAVFFPEVDDSSDLDFLLVAAIGAFDRARRRAGGV